MTPHPTMTPLRAAIHADPRTLREIAEHAGISESNLSHFGRGTRSPNRETAERIALALDIPAAALWPGAAAGEAWKASERAAKRRRVSLSQAQRAEAERECALAAENLARLKRESVLARAAGVVA